jgi:RNA polymerase sigma-70 factor (ECF subfamily)
MSGSRGWIVYAVRDAGFGREGMSRLTEMLRKARRMVLRRGAPADEADDIVQEAFARLEAYTRAHEVRCEEAFLITAAANIVHDRKRRQARSPFECAADASEVADRQPLPDEVLHARERLRRAAAGLDQLAPEARRMLLAHRLDGLTFPAIAAQEGLTVAVVEKRVARAMHFLTRWMDGW